MRKNVLDLLTMYCNAELADFKCHQLYTELQAMVDKLGYHLKSECGKGSAKNYSRYVYLSISVYNQDNDLIEIYDEGYLSAATELIEIDKKERIRFLSWNDEDFVDSIHWIIRMLQKQKCSNGG